MTKPRSGFPIHNDGNHKQNALHDTEHSAAMMQEATGVAPTETFENGVTHLLMMMEELRRSCESTKMNNSGNDKSGATPTGKNDTNDSTVFLPVLDWRFETENIVERLDFLIRKALDDPGDAVKRDLYNHCQQKASEVVRLVLTTVGSLSSAKMVWDGDAGDSSGGDPTDGQAAVARIAELCIVVHCMLLPADDNNDDAEGGPRLSVQQEQERQQGVSTVIKAYSEYQKQILRQRVKPSIAYLAQWRKSLQSSNERFHRNGSSGPVVVVEEDDDDDDEQNSGRPHSNAITAILGQSSALVHPLLVWRENLPPGAPVHELCQASFSLLNEQTQLLTKTIATWFVEDRNVEAWMKKTADGATVDVDLTELDALVDEMAFCCQIFARYDTLLAEWGETSETIATELLPEWAWQYASLERFLGTRQLRSALQMATPVNIVMGLPIKVPSVVEDAQYLSTRALDRATSTRSAQAIGTVAHSLSHDIWSTDLDGGVYQALLEHRGCWTDPSQEASQQQQQQQQQQQHGMQSHGPDSRGSSAPNSGGLGSGFTGALLSALDEDLKTTKSMSTPPPSAPASGGFLGAFVGGGQQMQQVRVETRLCAINGIHGAAIACESLGQSLDAWLLQDGEVATASSMTQLAREELSRYAQAYRQVLDEQVVMSIDEWCGKIDGPPSRGHCLPEIRDGFASEEYRLDTKRFGQYESDDRLERILLTPLKNSILMSQLNRCDADVAMVVLTKFASFLSSMIVRCLWFYEKEFTDWGSLLLSKQVRVLQTYLEGLVFTDDSATASGVGGNNPSGGNNSNTATSSNTSNNVGGGNGTVELALLEDWEKLSQVVTVLQLERPADWSIYQDTSVLSTEDLQKTMSMRVDFSRDAIIAVCNQQAKADAAKTAAAAGTVPDQTRQ